MQLHSTESIVELDTAEACQEGVWWTTYRWSGRSDVCPGHRSKSHPHK